MREKTKACFDNILDTMSGADGGIKFARFMFAIKDIDEQAAKGNKPAKQLVELVMRFSKLIDFAQEGVK